MKEDETLLKACSTPLPADVDERSQEIQEEEDARSSLLVYDFVSEVCVACEVMLKSPWRSPLCYRCHTSLYPHRTISEEEFGSEQDLERFQKFNAIPHDDVVQETSIDDELFNRFPDNSKLKINSISNQLSIVARLYPPCLPRFRKHEEAWGIFMDKLGNIAFSCLVPTDLKYSGFATSI